MYLHMKDDYVSHKDLQSRRSMRANKLYAEGSFSRLAQEGHSHRQHGKYINLNASHVATRIYIKYMNSGEDFGFLALSRYN